MERRWRGKPSLAGISAPCEASSSLEGIGHQGASESSVNNMVVVIMATTEEMLSSGVRVTSGKGASRAAHTDPLLFERQSKRMQRGLDFFVADVTETDFQIKVILWHR